jgi:hypothetical protein
MFTLKFFVRENNIDFSVSQMSSKEMDAIEECIDDLLPQDGPLYWFEADLVFSGEEDDDDEPVYGRLRCFTQNPNPANGSMAESRIPFPIPQEILHHLAGKTFAVTPRQLGLNAWGRVDIRFETAE